MTDLKYLSKYFFHDEQSILLSRLNKPGLPIDFVSSNIAQFLGYIEDELLDAKKSFIDLVHIDDLIDLQDKLVAMGAEENKTNVIEYRLKHKNASYIIVRDTISCEFDEADNLIAYHSRVENISEIKKIKSSYIQQSGIDPLTRLPNRKNLESILNKQIDALKQKRQFGCVIIINIDRFKFINNHYSFDIGDKLLRLVAVRLQKILRPNDYLCRVSSDEFVCVIEMNKEKESSLKQAAMVSKKLQNMLSAPYNIDNVVLKITVSCGICLFPEAEFNANRIISFADIALTHAKSSGQNNIQYFDQYMQAKNNRWLNLEKDLISAINNNELELYFQPIVNKDRNIIAFESLLRWEHMTKGNIPPTEFIPIAENTGLLQQLGQYVIEKACDQLSIWQQEKVVCDERIKYLSVNVSPNQFWHSNFESHLKENLVSKKIDPKHLLIEITENIFVGDLDMAINKIKEIKKLGVKIALDDFGSGYSSLSYLMKLPIDIVKLDRAFVQDVHLDDVKATIIKSVCEIAKKLNLKVIAEGLETTEELQVLVRYDCDAYQGFYFFRPANLVNLKKILQIKPQVGFNDFNNTVELPSSSKAHVLNF